MVEVQDFQPGRTNRTTQEELRAGGKGINVSLVLQNLQIESRALGFVAGFTGEEILRQLDVQGVKHSFVRLAEGNSRINIKLVNEEGTEINGQGAKITKEEEQFLWDKFAQMESGDLLVLSGSIPQSLGVDWYIGVMEYLQEKNILVVIDTSGKALLDTLQYHPFLIKPNHHELSELFGVSINKRQESIPYGRKLQELGARNVLISLAGEGAVLIAENGGIFTAPAPQGVLRNSVGAGDSMVAGFIAGWQEKQDDEWAFQMAVAAGSASAFSENFATGEKIREVLKRVVYTKE
jgi:1-phosphofructokinase